MLGDFRNIYGIRVPNKLAPSKVSHMASSVVDIQPTIPAVKSDRRKPLHRPTTILKRENAIVCPGGIGEEAIVQIMSNAVKELHVNCHFLDSLPTQLQELKVERLQQPLQELRGQKEIFTILLTL